MERVLVELVRVGVVGELQLVTRVGVVVGDLHVVGFGAIDFNRLAGVCSEVVDQAYSEDYHP